MRYLFCLTLFACINLVAVAQSYMGFDADNFNGVHGVLSNPANIADSRLNEDANILSASGFTANNYYKIDYLDFIFDDEATDFEDLSTKIGADNIVNGVLNADILGPSVMITLSEKHAFALTTRLRSLTNVNNIDGQIINFFQTEDLNDIDFFFAPDVDGSVIFNNWVEYGASYARVLNTGSKVHFLKAGLSIKLLSGRAFVQAQADDVLVLYNSDSDTDPLTVFFEGGASYSFSDNTDLDVNFIPFSDEDDFNGDDTSFVSQTLGVGLDLGIVYEYRPKFRQNVSRDHVQEQAIDRGVSTYKYKVGFSILDLGAMKYDNTRLVDSDLNDININQLFGEFESDVKSGLGVSETFSEERFVLPTRVRLDVDAKLKDKFYLNMNTNISLVSRNNTNANRFSNTVMVSPRYESKWLTVFSPISYIQYGGVGWGAGARIGPLFFGSGTIFSNLIQKDQRSKSFDLYAGIKIPIFHEKPVVEEEDPTDGYKSNCDGCVKKEKKMKKVELDGYKGGIK